MSLPTTKEKKHKERVKEGGNIAESVGVGGGDEARSNDWKKEWSSMLLSGKMDEDTVL